MELLQLRYFCHAARTQNFSKTAAHFVVPPSNISQTIKRLESELGSPLFSRTANKVELNAAGRAFYEKAKAALSLLDEATDALRQSNEHPTIKINIHINRRVVMDAIEEYRKTHPTVSFITSHALRSDTEDFDIIVTDRRLPAPLVQAKATEEQLLLAYRKESFSFENTQSLQTAPFITMNSDSSMYAYTLNICKTLGFTPQIVLQSEDPFYIRKCIELGLGVCIVPELSWRGQFSSNIAYHSLGKYTRNTYLYRNPGATDVVADFYTKLFSAFKE